MPNIPIRTHAIIDYITGLALLAAPFILPFPDNPMRGLSFVFGAVIVMYSIMTDYPLGLLRFVPFPFHRGFDLLAGGGLIFSPIHFAVHGVPAVLFILAGAILILLTFLTRGRFSPTGLDHPIIPGA